MASDLEKQLKELDKQHQKGVFSDEEYAQRRSALITSGPSGKASGGKGGLLKFGMMGCVGVIAGIVIVVGGIIALLSAALSGTDVSEEGKDVRVALAPGTSGVIWPGSLDKKKTKVTILQLADGAQSDNQFAKPAEGKKYYALEVEVENVGTQEVSSLDWKMRDSNDAELSRAYVSGVGETLDVAYNLTPGGKAKGWVVFEMDAAATAKWIRADPNPFVKNDLYFDAQ